VLAVLAFARLALVWVGFGLWIFTKLALGWVGWFGFGVDWFWTGLALGWLAWLFAGLAQFRPGWIWVALAGLALPGWLCQVGFGLGWL